MIVVGKKVKTGKEQHLVIGKEYDLPEAKAKLLIANGQAEAKGSKKKTAKK